MNSSKTLQTPDADSARRRRGRRTHARLLLGMLGGTATGTVTPPQVARRAARDNGNGTVTDLATGLVWLQQANALGTNTWEEAVAACAKLAGGDVEGLADRSRAGQWRLPAAHEMLTLTKVGLLGGELSTNHPFAGLTARHQKRLFWTRTEGFHDSSRAFQVNLHGAGSVKPAEKSVHALAWPVKGKCRRLPRHTGRIPDLGATFARLTPSEKERAEINSLYDVQGCASSASSPPSAPRSFSSVPMDFHNIRWATSPSPGVRRSCMSRSCPTWSRSTFPRARPTRPAGPTGPRSPAATTTASSWAPVITAVGGRR